MKIIEHTADLGFKIKAKNYKELFSLAANAILKFTLRSTYFKKNKRKKKVTIKANSKEELLHNFLNELLFYIFVKKFYISKIKIEKINYSTLKAEIIYLRIKNIGDYILRELKSVTYHNLQIKKENDFYTADIIIDL